MRESLSVLVFSLLVLFAGVAAAQTSPCEGLTGNAGGLCNAYCEAMDCDSPDHPASDRACERKFQQFLSVTGGVPPCTDISCPCLGDGFPVFTSFADGSRLITGCNLDETPDFMVMTFDSSNASATVTIVDGTIPEVLCEAADSAAPPNELSAITEEEAMSCAELLVTAAEADLGTGACGM